MMKQHTVLLLTVKHVIMKMDVNGMKLMNGADIMEIIALNIVVIKQDVRMILNVLI